MGIIRRDFLCHDHCIICVEHLSYDNFPPEDFNMFSHLIEFLLLICIISSVEVCGGKILEVLLSSTYAIMDVEYVVVLVGL